MPLFMSDAPHPTSRSPSRRLGTLSAIRTVSRCPAPRLGAGACAAPETPTGTDAVRDVQTRPVETRIDSLAAPPADAADVYLRLHLLSHRLIRPHEANLDGVFGLLANVAWTSL